MRGSAISLKRFSRCAAGAVVILAGLASALPAQAEDIRVFIDYARILRIDRDVSKVIIGNPAIADVAVSDPRTIVLTGRSFGTTNLVILDGTGTPLVDEKVVVARNDDDTLRVYRSVEALTLTCTPSCERPEDVQPAAQ